MPAPSFFDIKGRHKHAAWSSLGSMSKFDAMEDYIEAVHEIFNDDGIYPSGTDQDDLYRNVVSEINTLYDLYSKDLREAELSSEGCYEKYILFPTLLQ